jgi:RimJ/RimL family protein N-acetyltransferase
MNRDAPEPAPSIWRGHRVRLRPVEPDDWRRFAELGRDDLVSRAAYVVGFPASQESVRRRTEQTATDEPSNDHFRWVVVPLAGDDEPVGTINTHSCDRRVGSFSYGVAVAPEAHGRGYGSEAIRLVLRYYFDELGYQKAQAHVYEFNDASRRLHERLGFRPEGRLRRMAFHRRPPLGRPRLRPPPRGVRGRAGGQAATVRPADGFRRIARQEGIESWRSTTNSRISTARMS